VNSTHTGQHETYEPHPIDTEGATLPASLLPLLEHLAEHNHDVWASLRIKQGWRYGAVRDDALKTHPDLRPYSELPDSEKQYDRDSVDKTLKAILKLGYRILPPDQS